MKSTIKFTPAELADIIGAVLEANGYSPDTVSITKGGELVAYDFVEVECELKNLTVRCSPENSLRDQINARQSQWMAMLTGQLQPESEGASDVDNAIQNV